MNATKAFSIAIQLAQKPAVVGFFAIIGLGITTAFATAISTLLALLIPVLTAITKAAIYGYPLFIAGLIAIKATEKYQTEETPTIATLPSEKPCYKHIKQIETIQNEVLITSPSAETIFDYHLTAKPPTWQQQILKEIRLQGKLPTEIQEASQPPEALAMPGMDTAFRRDAKPLNNQLAILIICWQAITRTAKLLDSIKASEMKSIAAELKIPKYRNMNKSQLLVEIVEAHENAPAFSE